MPSLNYDDLIDQLNYYNSQDEEIINLDADNLRENGMIEPDNITLLEIIKGLELIEGKHYSCLDGKIMFSSRGMKFLILSKTIKLYENNIFNSLKDKITKIHPQKLF